jgi:membrane associated rhomboid family serine protease
MDLPSHEPHADPREQARLDRGRFFRALFAAVAFVSALWWIELIGNWIGSGFGGLGVAPRTLSGLIGILTSPLVHGSVGHLINNTLPLIVLGTLALAIYPRAFKPAMALIWIGSGLGIWLFGRDSFHIGASGLNHGLMFFLFMLGLLRRDRPAVAAAMIAFFLYGGMLLTVLPGDPKVSWEAHLFGALFGTLAAILFFRRDPAPPRKVYSWETEDENMEPLQDELTQRDRDTYEPAASDDVPVLWQRPDPQQEPRGVVVPFRRPVE